MTHSRKSTIRAILLTLFLLGQPAQAQTVISPANDATTVTETREGVAIEGGNQAETNLFHSFKTFQLTEDSVANFLVDPSTERIFARITGGNEAYINGILTITGAPADLFLLNPNGIIFGADAVLKLPANLTATTADYIGFANGTFSSIGNNNYDALVGPPNAFVFDQAGTIRNEGDLLLPSGQLTLAGSNIVNQGTLTAETLQVREVSEGDVIRLSRSGSLLNLEFSSDSVQSVSAEENVTATDIPKLLTSGTESANQIVTNPDGQTLLTTSSTELNPVEPSDSYHDDPYDSGPDIFLGNDDINDNDGQLIANKPLLLDDSAAEVPDSESIEQDDFQRENFDFEEDSQELEEDGPQRDTISIEDFLEETVEDGDDYEGDSDDQRESASMNAKRSTRHVRRVAMGVSNASAVLEELETLRSQEFSNYFGRELRANALTLPEIQTLLTDVHSETGNQSVIVYIKTPKLATGLFEQTSTALELLIFTSSGDPISLVIPNVTQADLAETVEDFRRSLITSARVGSKRYLTKAQTLYQWLIKPIEDELGPEAIDTILFSMDSGLRTVPIAALHDGQQFLIEKYGVGMVPSLGLMDPSYRPLGQAKVLAMGASTFEDLQPLPAVPAELETIDKLWPSRKFLNETFTQKNLINQQKHTPAQIIHLATHAEFSEGNADDSYIQLWDQRLQLSDIHTLGWGNPTVDLLVLSACRTALGDSDAEMGFAGLAVASGVRSALASLWTVSDVGTFALMSEFYHQLMDSSTKSDALRTAQLAMLKGNTRLEEKQLPIEDAQLPDDLQGDLADLDLSHPYFWAGFTLIGSPW